MYLFTYWENTKEGKPGYINLCQETITRYKDHFEINHLNSITVQKYITIPKPLLNLPVRYGTSAANLRSAYIRIALLKKYGGMWVDLDTIALSNFPALKLLSTYDFVYCKQDAYNKDFAGLDILQSKKDGELISVYFDTICKIIKSKSTYKREEFGSSLLTPYILSPLGQYSYGISNDLAHPIPFTESNLFFEDWHPEQHIPDDAYCCALYNSIFTKKYKQLSLQQLLNQDILLTRIFKLALS